MVLDRAIDIVARQMTSAEPPVWLRARVLDQIEPAPRSKWIGVPAWTWMSAAAILVLAVASSVWVLRPQPVRQAPPVAEAGAGPSRGGGPASQTAAATRPAEPEATVALAVARPSRPAAGPTPEPEAESAALIEWRRLTPEEVSIDPIAVTSLQPPVVEVDEIALEPLGGPEPLTIPSLDPGSSPQDRSEPSRR